MKRFPVFNALLTVMALAPLLCFCRGAEAAAVEVILLPSSAEVTELSQASVRLEGQGKGKATLILPGGIRQESLTINPEGEPAVKISSLSWKARTSREALRLDTQQKELRSLTEEKKRLQASIKGLEAQIAFWQSQTKAKTKTLNDARNMSAAISWNTKKAWQEKLNLEGECEKLDQRIATLREGLNKPRDPATGDWEVTLALMGLKPEHRTISLRYSYVLSDCGWTPLYRLEAKPGQERIEFTWEAEAWQNSSQDWRDVKLSLASRPEGVLQATHKPAERKIGARKEESRQGSRKKARQEAVTAESSPGSNLSFQRFLGQSSVPGGRKVILPVENAAWPATFTSVLRPFSGQSAELIAVATLPSPMEIPDGSALFLRDGALLGRQEFGLTGRKKTLSFGRKSDISGEVKRLVEPGKAPAAAGGKQVWDWHWQTVIRNEGSRPAAVRVEEPRPSIRDRRIKFEVRGEPPFAEDQSSAGMRTLEVPPKGSHTLDTFIHIEAPADVPMEMNWAP